VLDAVAAAAGDTSGAVRATALEVLAESADARAATVAVRALEDDSSALVRAVAAALLAHQGGPGRAAALARAVEDPDPDVRATAMEALPTEVEPVVLPVLHRALKDPDDRVWRPALARVIRSDREDLAGTWKAIRDSEPAKRRELIRAVEGAGEDEVARLGLRYAEALDWADRALAIEVLARARTPAAIQAILDALVDPDPVVRRAAASALRSVRTVRAVPALAQSLSDPAPDVRMESVRALSLIDDDRVLDPLVGALKDPAMSVREAATDALARWRSPGVARRLAGALRTPELRRQAGALLERMGRAAVEPLVEVITGEDHEVAAVAGALLSRIAGAEGFVRSLSSRDPEVRRTAVEVLGAIGGPTSSEALITALGDPDPAIRVRVAALLAELADPRALEPLKRAYMADPVPEVAAAAEDALRRLGGMPGRPASSDAPVEIRDGDGIAGSQEP
jgi:HEAT repeat protein